MKHLFLFLSCLLLSALAPAQQDCSIAQYQKLLTEADQATARGQYDLAINKLQSAKICRADKEVEVSRKIIVVFDKVNGERQAAIRNAEEARQQQKIAKQNEEEAKRHEEIAIKSAEEASVQKNLAEQKALEAKNEALRAEKALQNLKISLEEIIRFQMAETDELIRNLQYKKALDLCVRSKKVGVGGELIALRIQEIGFVFAETRRNSEAVECLRIGGFDVLDTTRASLLEKIMMIDHENFEFLKRRYFPVMLNIEGGQFCMGMNCDSLSKTKVFKKGEKIDRKWLENKHFITLDSFKMAQTETTVWQFYIFTQNYGYFMTPPPWGLLGDHPVIYVNWYDAIRYANWLSKRKGLLEEYSIDGEPHESIQTVEWPQDQIYCGFRLPTEAEWEYAARGGLHVRGFFPFSGGSELDSVAWYVENSDGRTHPVASKKANEIGLFDLTGNSWEWCWDEFGSYASEEFGIKNPRGPGKGWSGRVLRGGSWYVKDIYCRLGPGNRLSNNASDKGRGGFRVVQSWIH